VGTGFPGKKGLGVMVSLLLEAEKIADFTHNFSIPSKLYLLDHLKAISNQNLMFL
jgi:hypothetical protein